MRGTAGQAEDDTAKDVRVQGLLSVAFLEGLAPGSGGEFEDAVVGPAWEQAEQVAHVREEDSDFKPHFAPRDIR